MHITRRSFLKTSLLGALSMGVPTLLKPYTAAGAAGTVREFNFSASRSLVDLGSGSDFWAWTYNGQLPGPEIRVKEGEIIRVILKNFLPEETTIHWHGIPLPNPMDGVPGITQKGVAPGETFIYEFEAKPAGTFFYHSHAGYQLDQGLYGALIIEPAVETRSYDREYTLLLEDWVMKDEGGTADTPRRASSMGMMGGRRGGQRSIQPAGSPLLEPVYDDHAVNGKVYSAMEPLKVKKGDKVKLRLINSSSATMYTLSLAGHPLTITHSDGNPIKPIETDIIRIGMGERYDVEFIADNPGNWLLAALEQGNGESRLRIPIKYDGIQAGAPVLPQFRRNMRFASYWDMEAFSPEQTSIPAKAQRSFSQTLSGGMMGSPYWTINGRVYPDTDSLIIRKGDLVRISYMNQSMMPHPMHLHGHFYKVVNPNLPSNRWIMKDTVIVNHMERIDIEFLADNPGKWFHHCHNLYHMMAGMTNVVIVK